MIRKFSWFFLIGLLLVSGSCVKETYNMNKVSDNALLSPTIAIPLMNGDMTLADMVKSVDTVIFGDDKMVKFVFSEDSVFNLNLEDFYDFTNMVTFSETFQLGDLSINPFQVQANFTLNQIRGRLGEPYYTSIGNLNNTTSPFPAFPTVNLGNIPFPSISNVERAEFSSGYLVISVTNNLPAPLKPISIRLYNVSDNSPIGNQLNLQAIPIGETRTDSINLANTTVRNQIQAEVVLAGSDGNPSSSPISLESNSILITAKGRNLKVRSGRVILPPNQLNSSSGSKVIAFDPGNGIEITEFKINTGNLSYQIQKPAGLTSTLTLNLPTTIRDGNPLTQVINMGVGPSFNNNISFNNTTGDLGEDPLAPFNRMPYSITISSSGIVEVSSSYVIGIDLRLLNPNFDYIKGYFGQEEKVLEPEIIDLEIDEILSNISGDIFIANPSFTINYSNSFAVPVKVDLKATGRRDNDTVELGLEPFTISHPLSAPAIRDISASKVINKDNTDLPELVSMLPEEIKFYGSAKMNPEGDPEHRRNNFVFGNSRILGSLEVEIPMELSAHLEITDTLDNFLTDVFDEDNDMSWDEFNLIRVDFNVDNGFPVGLELEMNLYDSVRHRILESIDATEFLKPAPVNAAGKVNGTTRSSASIILKPEFCNAVNNADKVILNFRLNTTGADNIKIYSDYRIGFKAAVVVNKDFNLN